MDSVFSLTLKMNMNSMFFLVFVSFSNEHLFESILLPFHLLKNHNITVKFNIIICNLPFSCVSYNLRKQNYS